MSEDKSWSKYAPYFSLGLEIAVGICIPIFAGYWLDEYFGLSPWLLLLGCLLGVISVFAIIFRLNKRLDNQA